MKHFFNPRVCGLLLTLLLLAGGTQTALAVGTASNTLISNSATVDYEVGGLAQTAITSAVAEFRVDNKVDLTVDNLDVGTITVAPGSTVRVLTFSVTNDGNTTQGYLLSVVTTAAAIPMGSVEIWIDNPIGSPGVYDVGTDTLYVGGTNAGDLDPNSGTDNMTVFIVADTPLVAVDATVDNYSLLATTTDSGTTTVTLDTALDTPGGVEVVFADAPGTAAGDVASDGTHSDNGTYTVGSATLTVTKSAVVDDGLGTTFAIPGATVTYTIVVTNTGGTDATTVVISDVIPPETTLVSGSITLDTGGGPVVQPDSAPVTVTVPTLTATVGTATITFQVTID